MPFEFPVRLDDPNDLSAHLIEETYHCISAGRGYLDKNDSPSGFCLTGLLTTNQAAFIVTACNNHGRLVAALQLVVEQDDRSGEAQRIRETDADGRTEWDEHYLGAIDVAHSALASAAR